MDVRTGEQKPCDGPSGHYCHMLRSYSHNTGVAFPRGGGVLQYQNGWSVPLEPHGAHGEREKSRNLGSTRENY